MASDLRLLYKALAALNVGAAGSVPTVFNYDALPTSVTTAVLPARLLLPFGTKLDTTVNAPVSFGGRATVTWKITDLLLWDAVGQNTLASVAPALLEYAETYINELAKGSFVLAFGGVTAVGGVVEGFTIEPGVFTYPAESQYQYFGAEITLNVRETI